MACSQLPKLLGVAPDTDDTGFFRVLWSAVRQVGDANLATVLLSAVSIALLLVMAGFAPRLPGPWSWWRSGSAWSVLPTSTSTGWH